MALYGIAERGMENITLNLSEDTVNDLRKHGTKTFPITGGLAYQPKVEDFYAKKGWDMLRNWVKGS